jgi:hypothetical protein
MITLEKRMSRFERIEYLAGEGRLKPARLLQRVSFITMVTESTGIQHP